MLSSGHSMKKVYKIQDFLLKNDELLRYLLCQPHGKKEIFNKRRKKKLRLSACARKLHRE